MSGPSNEGAVPLLRSAEGNDPKTNQLSGRINANFKPNSSDWQLIGGVADDVIERLTSRRVFWLRNNFSLPDDLAALVAEIHFGHRGGRP